MWGAYGAAEKDMDSAAQAIRAGIEDETSRLSLETTLEALRAVDAAQHAFHVWSGKSIDEHMTIPTEWTERKESLLSRTFAHLMGARAKLRDANHDALLAACES